MTSADLQFDTMDVDISLAKAYLEKKNIELVGNIVLTDPSIESYVHSLNTTFDNTQNRFKILLSLSNAIEANMDLFCQLEYIYRRVPLQLTKLDLQMIIGSFRNPPVSTEKCTLVMNNTSPLMDLCAIGIADEILLMVLQNAYGACNLFLELSSACGLVFTSSKDSMSDLFDRTCIKNEAVKRGCIGVVTEKSDIDSAVAVFLSAPRCPFWNIWRIRRILVQESVYDRFKEALAWGAKSADGSSAGEELKSMCSDIYHHDNGLYLTEYVGVCTEGVTPIEAYRTTKELIAMTKSYAPFGVSLWSSDVPECNEIALAVTAPVVWVNDYGKVEPTITHRAYITHIELPSSVVPASCGGDLDKVSKLQATWAKLTWHERRQILLGIDMDNDFFKAFHDEVLSFDPSSSFIHVASNTVTIGLTTPLDVHFVNAKKFVVRDFAKGLLNGSGFLINSLNSDNKLKLSRLEETGRVPVRIVSVHWYYGVQSLRDKLRVIQTSFGTIFAN